MTVAVDNGVRPSLASPEPQPARFTKAEYLRMVDLGAFDGVKRRTFLFRGELIQVASMGWEHWHGIRLTSKWAFNHLQPAFEIVVQAPTDAQGDSVPEPDVAVYAATEIARRPYPNRAELFIEVADSSLKLDREKAHEYAATAREYWILDVRRRVLHVYRNPHADSTGLFGVSFDPPTTFAEGETIAPLCQPTASVVVRDLLPPIAGS